MYNAYFGFKESPFSIAPDPRYLYMTTQHREALAHLIFGLNSEGGCILLSGEVGTGKTTVCRCLLEQTPAQANIALVLNPKVSAIELLETICDELKIAIPQGEHSVKTCIDRINRFLLEAHARGEKTVLIIDEAQNLDSTVLEQLRLLTNLETNQRKLLQIIILGQPELLEILSRDEMRQLAQRITARFHLRPLAADEVRAYITHRLAVAGQNVQLFPEPSIRRVCKLSHGIPRLINIICDRALLGAYVQNQQQVDVHTVNTAAKEVFGELDNSVRKTGTGVKWPLAAAAAAGIGAVALIVAVQYFAEPVMESAAAVTEAEPGNIDLQAAAGTPVEATAASPDPDAGDNRAPAGVEPAPAPAAIETAMAAPAAGDTATASAVAAAAALPVPADEHAQLDALIRDAGNNKPQAFSDLFREWKREYRMSKHGNACDFAVTQGLNCLYRQGNLRSLAKLNRPAVMKLVDTQGNSAYVILTRIDGSRATLRAGDVKLEVASSTLDDYWLGEYTLLWQMPPYYQYAIQPGSKGPVVQWLDQQLARIYGQTGAPTIRDSYNDALVAQVKQFQSSVGLVADGVAGPNTLIQLNTRLGLDTPRLTGTKEQS